MKIETLNLKEVKCHSSLNLPASKREERKIIKQIAKQIVFDVSLKINLSKQQTFSASFIIIAVKNGFKPV